MAHELIAAGAGKLFAAAVEHVTKHWHSRPEFNWQTESDLIDRLSNHATTVRQWSEDRPYLNGILSAPHKNELISLRFDNLPRRYRGKKASSNCCTEADLFAIKRHQIVLGDPGAGKSSTIKRAIAHCLSGASVNLAGPPAADLAPEFPILVRIRTLNEGESLVCRIASILGIPYTLQPDARETAIVNLSSTPGESEVEGPILLRLDSFLYQILERNRFAIFIDGLDEHPAARIPSLLKEVEECCLALTNSRVMASCRSGAYTSEIQNASVFEILPLSPVEVRQLAELWLPSPAKFLEALNAAPLSGLIDRPLLVLQLAFVFHRRQELPRRLSDIYEIVTRTLLEEWNEKNRIHAKSQYGDFGVGQKLRFLNALAFDLLVENNLVSFKRSQLQETYERIHQLFSLPRGEAVAVVREIETHTGILIDCGYDGYEFFHFTAQEYFAGQYMRELPFDQRFSEVSNSHPEVLAVSIASAINPARRLRAIAEVHCDRYELNVTSVARMLKRLVTEGMPWEVSHVYGETFVLFLLPFDRMRDDKIDDLWTVIRSVPEIAESLRQHLTGAKWTTEKFGLGKYVRTSMVNPLEHRRTGIPRVNLSIPKVFSDQVTSSK